MNDKGEKGREKRKGGDRWYICVCYVVGKSTQGMREQEDGGAGEKARERHMEREKERVDEEKRREA